MPVKDASKCGRWLTRTVIFAVTAVIIIFIMFSGSVTAKLDDSTLVVQSGISSKIIALDEISEVTILNTWDAGSRKFGTETAKILSGDFSNSVSSSYFLATYKSVDKYIRVVYGEQKLAVFNLSSSDETTVFYNELKKAVDNLHAAV